MRVELIETRARDRLLGLEAAGNPQRVVLPGIGVFGALTPSLGLLARRVPGVFARRHPVRARHRGTQAFTSAQPELAVNYEAGVRFTPPRLRVEAIGFFNDYQNLTSICTIASCGPGLGDLQSNAGKAHIYGAEFFARADNTLAPGYAIPVIAAYTYTHTELLQAFVTGSDAGHGGTGRRAAVHPAPPGRGDGGVRDAGRGAGGGGSYVSAMREHAGQGPATVAEPFTDPAFILDVTARVPLKTARLIGQVYVNVRNILGAEDIAARLPFGARPVAPRWVQVGTKWSF